MAARSPKPASSLQNAFWNGGEPNRTIPGGRKAMGGMKGDQPRLGGGKVVSPLLLSCEECSDGLGVDVGSWYVSSGQSPLVP